MTRVLFGINDESLATFSWAIPRYIAVIPNDSGSLTNGLVMISNDPRIIRNG